MKVFSVFRDSLVKYRENPILLLPVTVSILQSIVASIVLASLGTSIRTQYFNLNAILQSLAILIFNVIVAFIVGAVLTVGYSAMAARITKGRKCKLSDWEEGLRRYFLRILAITVIVGVLGAIIVGLIVFAAFMATFSTNRRLVPNIFTPTTLPIFVVFTTVITLFTYCCYAAATVDDTDLSSSITRGFRALRHGGTPMLTLFIIVYIISQAASYAITPRDIPPSSLTPAFAAERLSLIGIISTVVPILLTPLWYLVVFAIYRGVSLQLKK